MTLWRGTHRHISRAALLAMALISLITLSHPAHACPNGGVEGQMIYNATDKVMQYCDGTNWIGMNLPGSGSGGCTNPTAEEGAIVFNAEYRVNQVCAGSIYMAMGPYSAPSEIVYQSGSSLVDQGNYVKIAAGPATACGIDTKSDLYCWGSDNSGALGDGSPNQNSATPILHPVSGPWQYVDVADSMVCGVRTSGEVYCAGGAVWYHGSTPVDVSDGKLWKQVEQSYGGRCGIRDDDTIECWDNSTSSSQLSALSWKSISGTETGTKYGFRDVTWCAVRSDDTLWCWGADNSGTMGNGAGGASATPDQVAGGGTWIHVSMGGTHGCGVKSDNTGWCWGSDDDGKLGNAAGNTDAPDQVQGGHSWLMIEAGAHNTCGIRTDDTLWCWGDNEWGQLGDGTTTDRSAPVQVEPGTLWELVNPGGNFTCGIRKNGARYCWGENASSQLGNLNTPASPNVPTPIEDTNAYGSMAGGFQNWACAIRLDGSLWCWGNNGQGRLGDGTTTSRNIPTQVSGGGTWQKVVLSSAYQGRSCGIQTDDTLWCWGVDYGLVPTQVGAATWKDIAIGSDHYCGIQTDDTLWCWGNDDDGELGNGAGGNEANPAQIEVAHTWNGVAAGHNFSCAIRSDDTLWCWGDGGNNSIGDGSSIDRQNAVQVAVGGSWQHVSAQLIVAHAIRTDGSLWRWGFNYGNTPTEAFLGTTWDMIGAKGWPGNTCGLQTDGTLWCWGGNETGQLGTGNSESSGTPVQVSGGGIWNDVVSLWLNTCAIRSDGQIHCWGQSDDLLAMPSLNTTVQTPLLTDCGGPPTQAGGIRYHSVSNSMIYCNGVGFRAIGK